MPELYGFSLTCSFSYKGGICDSVLTRENTDQRKPLFWHKDKIVDSVFIRESTGQRKLLFWHKDRITVFALMWESTVRESPYCCIFYVVIRKVVKGNSIESITLH